MTKSQRLLEKAGENSKTYKSNFNDLKEIEIALIEVNPFQPRKTFNDESIKELSESIKKDGLIQAVVITDKNILIAGERRKRACELLGWKHIKCVVRKNVSNDDLERLALLENVQREDLNLFDQSIAISKLVKKSSERKVAEMLGKSRSYVQNRMTVSKMDDETKEYVLKNNIGLKNTIKIIENGVELFEKNLKVVEDKGGGFLKSTKKSSNKTVEKNKNLNIAKVEVLSLNKYSLSDVEKDVKNMYSNFGFEAFFSEKDILVKVAKNSIDLKALNAILKVLNDSASGIRHSK